MPTDPLLRTRRRHHFSSLGRHLHRSVLATCLTPDALRQVIRPGALPKGGAPALAVDAAARYVADDAREADALHRALDALHKESVQRFDAVRTGAELLALWTKAVATADMPGAYWALLTHPEADRSLRHLAFGDVSMLALPAPPATLAMLLSRRSVSPRRLVGPAPEPEHLDLMLEAALSAPDHGRLHPWRVIEFRADARDALAVLFEEEKQRRDPMASTADRQRARAHATDAPCLLAFVVSLRKRRKVPLREQWLAAGGALGNLMNAAHELGYGAMVLSGDRCYDRGVSAALGLTDGEFLAGFVSLGTIADPPPEAARPLSQAVWSCWSPGAAVPTRRNSFAWQVDDQDIR